MGKFWQHRLTMIAFALLALALVWDDMIGPGILAIAFYFLMRQLTKSKDKDINPKPEEWVKIYSSTNTLEADIVAGNLENEGIEAVVINKKSSSYNMFGAAEVNVRQADVERALEIVKEGNTGKIES